MLENQGDQECKAGACEAKCVMYASYFQDSLSCKQEHILFNSTPKNLQTYLL